MAGAAKADLKYGFWVGIGVLVAIMIWGVVTMALHGGIGRLAGNG